MQKILSILSILSILTVDTYATVYTCVGDKDKGAIILRDGDYGITVSFEGRLLTGVWKGHRMDEKGKAVKLFYLYGEDNIWIEAQNDFKETHIRIHSDMDNMHIIELTCKRYLSQSN